MSASRRPSAWRSGPEASSAQNSIATVSAGIVDLPSIVAGEYAENEVRKHFTPSERVGIAEAIEQRSAAG